MESFTDDLHKLYTSFHLEIPEEKVRSFELLKTQLVSRHLNQDSLRLQRSRLKFRAIIMFINLWCLHCLRCRCSITAAVFQFCI